MRRLQRKQGKSLEEKAGSARPQLATSDSTENSVQEAGSAVQVSGAAVQVPSSAVQVPSSMVQVSVATTPTSGSVSPVSPMTNQSSPFPHSSSPAAHILSHPPTTLTSQPSGKPASDSQMPSLEQVSQATAVSRVRKQNFHDRASKTRSLEDQKSHDRVSLRRHFKSKSLQEGTFVDSRLKVITDHSEGTGGESQESRGDGGEASLYRAVPLGKVLRRPHSCYENQSSQTCQLDYKSSRALRHALYVKDETSTIMSDLDLIDVSSMRSSLVSVPAQTTPVPAPHSVIQLPWGATRERGPDHFIFSTSVKPGEFILQTLFAEFTVLAEKKIDSMLEPANNEKPLSKLSQRGEDPSFEQLLNSLGSVAEHCLPSLLSALFEWYEVQNPTDESGNSLIKRMSKCKGDKDMLCDRRDLAVDFIYCLALIEVLKQLPYHPGHDELVAHVLAQAFRHFRYKEGAQPNPNADFVADLYAEVVGIIAQSRFMAVRKAFMTELKGLRSRDQNNVTIHNIINLLMGMKFFRVKMCPMEEFQACIQFLHECGTYFIEVKDKEFKHAFAGLFVEILLPVAAVAKNEVNVPVLKKFVEMMYTHTLMFWDRRKHTLALFPMVTCLLCVSHKQFFLSHWPSFLNNCLSKLKDRDPKMARVALESLYRLLWVYMIRIKCESNTTTTSRLQSIVSSLFPKGQRVIIPKDAPMSIFVKIIQFIGQERLDFAMNEIIFDLLCVGKPSKAYFSPERMCIGLRAFLVIADGLQQKEGDPPMPGTIGVTPSGNTLRVKKTFISKYLSEQTAKTIGIVGYYSHVRKAFDSILKYLDSQVGKSLLRIRADNVARDPDEIITGERKAKMDLFRTCVAAIPRLLPEGMSRQELIELLAKLTVHIDEELGRLAFQSLQNILVDLPEWRDHVLQGFVTFVEKEVTDSHLQQVDMCSRRVTALLAQWKLVVQMTNSNKEKADKGALHDKQDKADVNAELSVQSHHGAQPSPHQATLHMLEGFALVMLCSCKPTIVKTAVAILRDVRLISTMLGVSKGAEPCVLDIFDKACPLVLERVLPHLPSPDKAAVSALSTSAVDFQWLVDRTALVLTGGAQPEFDTNPSSSVASRSGTSSTIDPWIEFISICMAPDYVLGNCPTAVQHAWPALFHRLQNLGATIDPLGSFFSSSSILRGSGTKKMLNERDMYMRLWKNYVIMGCCIAPPSHPAMELRSVSPEPGRAATPDNPTTPEKSSEASAQDLFKILVPLISRELADATRETIIMALGHINPAAFRNIVDELVFLIREAIDRKTESVKRRKKRDVTRLSLVRIFNLMAEGAIFAQSPTDVIDPAKECLCQTFVDYINGARLFLESEADKDLYPLQEIRQNFSDFIRHLIRNTAVNKRHKLLSRELRSGLCTLFANWSGKFGAAFVKSRSSVKEGSKGRGCTDLELSALQALAAVLCCGAAYDPKSLNEYGCVFSWLDTLLGNHDDKIKEKVYGLAQETIVLLLEYNPDAEALLEWVIDRCYTGSHEVADGCFNAIASVFNDREYPCERVAVLSVTLMNTGCPRVPIRETAIQLLHLLYKRFFLDDRLFVTLADGEGILEEEEDEDRRVLQDSLLSGPYNSQLCLSNALARLHPDLTMPVFSEITQRAVTANPVVRQTLLVCILPWLYNLELVDPNLPASNVYNLPNIKPPEVDFLKPPLKGEGWGSPESTNMVLNNLLYLTARFGDEHAKEIEDTWAAIVACWPGNLGVVLRYIIIVLGMYPNILLPYAKQVALFLSRARPDRLIEELMTEMRTIEPLNFNVERMETPPFYRLTRRQQTITSPDDDEPPCSPLEVSTASGGLDTGCGSAADVGSSQHLERGHIKRSSMEDPIARLGGLGMDLSCRTESTSSARSEGSTHSSGVGPASRYRHESAGDDVCTPRLSHRSNSPLPHPLPMPAFGGYYAPLSELLNEEPLPNPPYQRCNLAVMLLADIIMDCMEADWTVHMPLILHILFLGMDHPRPLIHEHCKKLLLNLLIVAAAHHDHFSMAKIILGNKGLHDVPALTVCSHAKDYSFLEESSESRVSAMSAGASSSAGSISNAECVSQLVHVSSYETTEQTAKALIEFIVTRKARAMWSYEDITSRVHLIKSADELGHFLEYVVRIFKESLPQAHVEQRWAQEALHLALSCSSRHYAGRSFQVFRALNASLTSSDISDILSRLVETIGEQGEDMQGYVTEIMLTLEAAVDNLDLDMRPLMKELFFSTPNLAKEGAGMKKSATIVPMRTGSNVAGTHHNRSTSYNLPLLARRMTTAQDSRFDSHHNRLSMGDAEGHRRSSLARSRSTQSLKHIHDPHGQEDRLTILSQMFWIAVSILESDFEYEFLLAVRLLDKVLQHIQPDRPECKEKLEKIQQQINWPRFPGVQALLLKGLTNLITADNAWNLLSKLTTCINAPVINPNHGEGFPMNVIALLPQLVEHYENPTLQCREAADHIAEMGSKQDYNLDNLCTVMTLYSQGTFNKISMQWTKCVIKYLYDVYAHLSNTMIVFLVEVLDKGPVSCRAAVLQVLNCMMHYIDLTSPVTHLTNLELLRVVAKYIENQSWKEAGEIIKHCVTRSSNFADPPPGMHNTTVSIMDASVVSLGTHTSFTDGKVMVKKELPGRTMDFSFDHSKVPIVGRKVLDITGFGLPDKSPYDTHSNAPPEKETKKSGGGESSSVNSSLERKHGPESVSLSPGASLSEHTISAWKKSAGGQAKTRERLVNLVNFYGPRVIPKSPSKIEHVIFDSPTGTMERQQSSGTPAASSGEPSLDLNDVRSEMDTLESGGNAEQQIQLAFDFLEGESEPYDRCLFWGVNRIKDDEEEEPDRHGDISDDETHSVSPVDETPHDLPSLPTITLHNTTALDAAKLRLSGSSQSIHSMSSELDTTTGDTTDNSPLNASPSFMSHPQPPPTSLSLLHDNDFATSDVELQWRSLVDKVSMMSGEAGVVGMSPAPHLFCLFTKLFHDTKARLMSITKKACDYLPRVDILRDLPLHFSNLLDLVTSEVDSPFVFIDAETLSSSQLLERCRFSLMEIPECYDAYLMRQDQTLICLDQVRSVERQVSPADSSPGESNTEDLRLQMCLCLYRMHFQLLQLCESYSKLVSSISHQIHRAETTDISHDVLDLREEIHKAYGTLTEQGVSAFSPYQDGAAPMTQEEVERYILDLLHSREYSQALKSWRQLRELCTEDISLYLSADPDALLYLYCKNQADISSGVIAICQSDSDINEVCNSLGEIKKQVSQAVNQFSDSRCELLSVRHLDSSTL